MMIYAIIAAVLVAFDQYTKFVARSSLSHGGVVGFVPHIMDFVYVENRGAAFGILQDTRWLLIGMTFIVLVTVIAFAIKTKKHHPLFLLSVSLIVAGGIGNLIDRIFIGYVTDFLHFLFMDFPCFNIADICVCVGGVLIAFYLLFMDNTTSDREKK